MPEDQNSERTGTLVQSESDTVHDFGVRWHLKLNRVTEVSPGLFQAHAAAEVKVQVEPKKSLKQNHVFTATGANPAAARKAARLGLLGVILDVADGTA